MLSRGALRLMKDMSYLNYNSREVAIGTLIMGGRQAVRIQSMTNTPTLDIRASVGQCLQLWESGCELIRLAAPGIAEARALGHIRKALLEARCKIPLCADIHFRPDAALEAARHVEKIRINPGNYVDRSYRNQQNFPSREAVLEKALVHLQPLLQICRDHGTAIRLGVNHGSLSPRIIHTYGHTEEGMVASAMEFIELCENQGFTNLVISLKASRPGVTVRANRLLACRLMERGQGYPLHLGVTEAGEGADGRMISFAGIGTLLGEGLGDTIRVSLTEDPVCEIPVAQALRDAYAAVRSRQCEHCYQPPWNPIQYERRATTSIHGIGGMNPPVVISDGIRQEKSGPSGQAADFIAVTENKEMLLRQVQESNGESVVIQVRAPGNRNPIETAGTTAVVFNHIPDHEPDIRLTGQPSIIIQDILPTWSPAKVRDVLSYWYDHGHSLPLIVRLIWEKTEDNPLLSLCRCLAPGLLDGLIDGIWLDGPYPHHNLTEMAFGLLQATERRTTRTTYISCPGCARTSYDIQSVLKKIKAATSAYPHLRIGVMGCVVNGPGEMAGADYGYVGAGAGKVNLYKGKELIHKNIPEQNAVDALLTLIAESE